MWIIFIIVVAVIVIWAITGNNNDNEKIRQHYNNEGGFKSNFPNFVHILENEIGLTLKYDNGRKFCYTRTDNFGELNIGIKLEFNNVQVIFSELVNNGFKKEGINISCDSDNDKAFLTRAVGMSTANLNIPESTGPISKKHEEEWRDFILDIDNEEFIFEHVNYLYIIDDINPEKFLANLQYRKARFNLDNKPTVSIREILHPPAGFTEFFIVAYPDVYLWAQRNHEQVEGYKNLDNVAEDYFTYIDNLIPMYRSMINQYKREGNTLECI